MWKLQTTILKDITVAKEDETKFSCGIERRINLYGDT